MSIAFAIILTVIGMTAWFFAHHAWSAPVPNQDDPEDMFTVDYREYRDVGDYWNK